MTTVIEPTLFDAPHAEPVDEQTASLLALIDGDPIHAADRAVIVEAILRAAAENAGEVCPNRLRALLTDDRGNSRVFPNVIGSVIFSLRKRGVLVEIGWRTTTDSKSGNSGKPARVHRLVKRPT